MKLKIKFLKPFSNAVGKPEVEIDFTGNTLNELLNILVDKYPQLQQELYTEKNVLSEYLAVFVNDKPIAALKGIHTQLKNGDVVLFFVPISGG